MKAGILTFIFNFFTNPNILALLAAYLIAAMPFGLLLAKFFAKTDIKSAGSGSIGATNVLRVVKEQNPSLAKKLAVATILCDVLKGVIPILIAKFMGFSPNVLWGMAVFAVLGHCFSPYLWFSGGKGIATGAGVLACFIPLELLIAVVVWFVSGKIFKISSLASMLALLAVVISSFVIHPEISDINTHAPIIIIAFIIFYKHIPNIKRLFLGQEKAVI